MTFNSRYKELQQLIQLYTQKICLEGRKLTPMDMQISTQIELVFEDLFNDLLQLRDDADKKLIERSIYRSALIRLKSINQLLMELWEIA